MDQKKIDRQVERFRKGFPWMKILAPATPGHGICVMTPAQADEAVRYADSASFDGRCKFVPASGAASRMFKDIFAGLDMLENGKDVDPSSPVARLADRIEEFAFYNPELFPSHADSPEYRREVASKVLTSEGLGYGSKPKGVIRFHRYADGECRTAFAEHLVEGQEYMRNPDGSVNVTVTISPEHEPLFKAALEEVRSRYEAAYGVKYNIRFTFQDPETDTVAVDMENRPFLKDDGTVLMRPAGHGALIYNLNDVKEEVVSIKNIDNVSNERLLPVTARSKKVLMGRCLMLRDTIFAFLRELDEAGDAPTAPLCDRIARFLSTELCIEVPPCPSLKERAAILRSKLDRPIRVCGMVRNEGEPGGGPFIIEGRDGSTSLQILESVQIDKENPSAVAALKNATHFNPVDLVCCIRDYKGRKFDLLRYVDEDAGFISSKSYQGRELKALELPGLWNGSMSDWNTSFVEVPSETFNPVKVVLDLLRPAHQ